MRPINEYHTTQKAVSLNRSFKLFCQVVFPPTGTEATPEARGEEWRARMHEALEVARAKFAEIEGVTHVPLWSHEVSDARGGDERVVCTGGMPAHDPDEHDEATIPQAHIYGFQARFEAPLRKP